MKENKLHDEVYKFVSEFINHFIDQENPNKPDDNPKSKDTNLYRDKIIDVLILSGEDKKLVNKFINRIDEFIDKYTFPIHLLLFDESVSIDTIIKYLTLPDDKVKLLDFLVAYEIEKYSSIYHDEDQVITREILHNARGVYSRLEKNNIRGISYHYDLLILEILSLCEFEINRLELVKRNKPFVEVLKKQPIK